MRRLAIDPGALDQRMVLQRPDVIPDGQGGREPGWTDVASLFAQVEPLQAKDRVLAGQRAEVTAFRVTLRFREGVELGTRLAWGNRLLEILAVQDADGSRRFLRCAAREVRP